MPAGVRIYLKGFDRMEREANKVLKACSGKKEQVLLKAARKVKTRIQEKAEAQQKGSVEHTAQKAAYAASKPETTTYPAVAYAGIRPKKMPHAHLVEFGHGGPRPAPPHPFVRPAWDEIKDEIKNDIATDMGKAIEGKA